MATAATGLPKIRAGSDEKEGKYFWRIISNYSVYSLARHSDQILRRRAAPLCIFFRLRKVFLRKVCGGWGGIRTHETLARLLVFKTSAFNHSATHPEKSVGTSYTVLGWDSIEHRLPAMTAWNRRGNTMGKRAA